MKILIIDDDADTVNCMNLFLELKTIPAVAATSVSNAYRILDEEEISLVCTDWDLGDGTGLDILQAATNKNIPVVFLTGHDEDSYIDKAMSMGAAKYYIKGKVRFDTLIDDFITILEKKQIGGDFYTDGNLFINFSEMSAFLAEEPLTFTSMEYRILKVLVSNPQKVLTRHMFLEKLRDIDGKSVDEHVLTAAIDHVREKIEINSFQYIKSIYGIGYMWVG